MNSGISKEDKAKIIGVLQVLFPGAKLYLYGSRARGTYSKFSDIDIAIDTGQQISLYAINEAKSMLAESNILYNFDIVDVHRIPQKMKEVILKEGVLWTL